MLTVIPSIGNTQGVRFKPSPVKKRNRIQTNPPCANADASRPLTPVAGAPPAGAAVANVAASGTGGGDAPAAAVEVSVPGAAAGTVTPTTNATLARGRPTSA